MELISVVLFLGFLLLAWVIKSEGMKVREHFRDTVRQHADILEKHFVNTRQSLDGLRSLMENWPTGVQYFARLAQAMENLQTLLCGDDAIRETFRNAGRPLDDQEGIYLDPLLPQLIKRLDYIRRPLEKLSGELPCYMATQADLERAVDSAIQKVGSPTPQNMSVITIAARENLKDKWFNWDDFRMVLHARNGWIFEARDKGIRDQLGSSSNPST